MADEPRVLVQMRLRPESLDRVDKIAAAHDWSRSTALRTLLALGLEAWEAKHQTAQDKAPKR